MIKAGCDAKGALIWRKGFLGSSSSSSSSGSGSGSKSASAP